MFALLVLCALSGTGALLAWLPAWLAWTSAALLVVDVYVSRKAARRLARKAIGRGRRMSDRALSSRDASGRAVRAAAGPTRGLVQRPGPADARKAQRAQPDRPTAARRSAAAAAGVNLAAARTAPPGTPGSRDAQELLDALVAGSEAAPVVPDESGTAAPVAAEDGTWMPVPVPPPTYTLKPKAPPRPEPRPVEPSEPVPPVESAGPAEGSPAAGEDAETAEAEAPAGAAGFDLDAVLARRRAVNG